MYTHSRREREKSVVYNMFNNHKKKKKKNKG